MDVIAGIIADEMAIGMVNSKTTGARLIPAAGKQVGDWATLGGLFGEGPVMKVSNAGNSAFVRRGGRIPAPLQSLTNSARAYSPRISSIMARIRRADSVMPSARETFSASVSCKIASMD